MAFSLSGWTGDFTAELPGRKTFEALVTVTFTAGDLPSALFEKGDLDGTPWYYNLYVECLTPDAPKLLVTAVDMTGDHYVLKLLPWSFGGGAPKPLAAGAHLVTVRCLSPGGNDSATFASIIVPAKFKQGLKFTEATVMRLLELSRRAGPPRRGDG